MNAKISVYSKDDKVFANLKAAAKDSSFTVENNPPLNENLDDHFIICDKDTFLERKEDFEAVNHNLLYILSCGSDEENMILVEKHAIHHLVGWNEGVYSGEIIDHLKKTHEKKIWGLRPYTDPDADIKILSLSDSKYTNEMIQEALSHFDFQDYFSSPIDYIQVMANELISNSLYKGPNRKRHEQGLDSLDRKGPVFLKGSDLVQVTLGMDSRGVTLSVQDSFGGLSYELLMASLKRSFVEKTAMDKKDGAGLGLYLTFLHSNQFIINYKENFRTEVICIIEKNKRYKNYKQRIRSFHFFQEVPSEKTND
jgi:sigma-B regulation protein RsbU (phosphoserine phosphatase)